MPSRVNGWRGAADRVERRSGTTWRRSVLTPPDPAESSFGSSSIQLPDPSIFGSGIDARSLPYNASGGWGTFASHVVRVGIKLSDADRIRRPFEQSPWVRAGIKAIAGGFVRTIPRIWDRDSEDEAAVELEIPQLARLLTTPNPALTRRRLMRAMVTDLKLHGESFLFLQMNDGSPVPINADGTWAKWPERIIPAGGNLVQHTVDDSTALPIAYRYRTNAKAKGGNEGYSVTYPPEAVVAIIDYDPTYIFRGLGDVQSMARDVSLYFDTQRYLEANVENGGQPGGFITYEHRLSEDELAVRQEILNDELVGGDTGQRYKIIDHAAKFTPNPSTPKDLEYRSLLEWLRDAILAGLGVPGPVVGVFGQATYNNVETAYRELWQGPNGILSISEEISDALTAHFLRRGVSLDRRLADAEFAFDATHIEALKEDRTEQVSAAAEIASKRVGVSVNAALAAMGVDVQVEGGDKVLEDAAPVPPEDDEDDADEDTDAEDGDDDEDSAELAFGAGVLRADEETIPQPAAPDGPPDGGTPEMRGALLTWLNAYVRETKAKIKRAAEAPARESTGYIARSLDGINDPNDMTEADWRELLLDDAEWIERMTEATGAPLEDIYRAALARALEDVPGAPILSVSDPRVFKAMTVQQIKLSEGVTSRASQRVRKAILKALSEPGGDPAFGASMRQRIRAALPPLNKKLEGIFGTREQRAATIAQTEYGKADSVARSEQYRVGGVTEIQWFTSRDNAVRASHRPLHGEKIPFGARFSNGLRYPHDPDGPADQVISCRCTYRPTKRLKPDLDED